MSLYDVSIPQFRKMLHNLDLWLAEATEYAKSRGFETDVLVNARLAPDMFSFVRQVQSACDAAKFGAAYLAGTTPPAHPDTETTVDQIHARIRTVIAYLETVRREDCAAGEDRRISPPWLKGAWLKAPDYMLQVAMPNFYFHVTTAYDILRANGVLLGKSKFIGDLPVHTG